MRCVMLFSSKPIQFVFFSDEAANAFSDSSRRLLTWAGEGYSDSCRVFARECISRIEAPLHKIPLEDAEELLALLGHCCLTTEVAEPARTLWSNCVRIISDQIYKSVHQNEAA